jgi:hypothetical protein
MLLSPSKQRKLGPEASATLRAGSGPTDASADVGGGDRGDDPNPALECHCAALLHAELTGRLDRTNTDAWTGGDQAAQLSA